MEEDKKPHKIKHLILFLLIVGVLVGGYIIIRPFSQTKSDQKAPTKNAPTVAQTPTQTATTPTPTPSPSPTPTPQPKATTPTPTPSPSPTPTPQPKATTTPTSKPAYTPAPAKVETVKPAAPTTPPPSGSTGTTSWTYGPTYGGDNWAGYVSLNGTFTAVSGSWVVPSPSASSPEGSGDSAWVGIGGWTTDDCIQTGSDDWIQNGQVKREAWYELLPADSVWLPNITINAGDTMQASVAQISQNYWKITIADKTDNESYTTNVDYKSSYTSADWIEEDTSGDHNSLETIDEFKTVSFLNGLTTKNGVSKVIGATVPSPVTMESDSTGKLEESPSVLNSAGSGFTVNQTN